MEPVLSFAPDLSDAAGHLAGSLRQQLRAAILDGRIAPGATLPSSRNLAAELGIARNTVVGAYDLLVAEGYVLPRRGAKAVVADLHARPFRGSVIAPPIEDPRLAPFWRTPFLRPAPRALPETNFRVGVPDWRHFPHETWRKLTAQALRAFAKAPFGYPASEGLPELRAAIAQHVAFARAVACTPEDVIVTSGAQQAFDLLARLLVTPGKTRVAVENPGYPPLRAAFSAAGAELVPVPVDDEGLCVECLPDDVQIIMVTPSHQSPTGAALSLRRRMPLLDYARTRNAVVIEDDYDGEFRFGGRPLDALQTVDRDGLVFYVGTFSKSLYPALRKGFVVAPGWAREPLAAVKHCADSHSDAVTQSVLAAFIREGHLARHVRRMRGIYAERRVALMEGFDALGEWLEPIPSEAGLHAAARIRDPAQASRIMALVREHAPGAQSTNEYAMGPLKQPAIAFGYGVIDAAEIRTRFGALGRAMRDQLRAE
jgi:GntR family transcriptional regulator/MocR family aminotransferase